MYSFVRFDVYKNSQELFHILLKEQYVKCQLSTTVWVFVEIINNKTEKVINSLLQNLGGISPS